MQRDRVQSMISLTIQQAMPFQEAADGPVPMVDFARLILPCIRHNMH
jgi:hypothetical protein